MGFRPNCFTCLAHLYLYYTLLVSYTYASYMRHWCIFSYYENTIQFSSNSNMVSEPLLWLFLSSLVFISVTPFSTLLSPSQQSPQPFAVEPQTSSSRRPWVLDLQLPSLRNFTLHRPLPFTSPLQILLQSRFWRYHRDRLAPIYTIVKASTLSETTRATQRLCSFDHAPSTRHCTSRFSLRRLHVPSCASTSLIPFADVTADIIHVSPSLHRCWHHLLASVADVII